MCQDFLLMSCCATPVRFWHEAAELERRLAAIQAGGHSPGQDRFGLTYQNAS
jgi:hypothetical protein